MAANDFPLVKSAAGKEDVEQAIVVVIEQRHTATERFDDREMVCFFAIFVGEIDAGLRSHIAKPTGAGRRFGLRRICCCVRRNGFIG